MRLAIAGFAHETVTFLPQPTPASEFERGALRGAQLLAGLHGSASVGGGFIAEAARAGVSLSGLV